MYVNMEMVGAVVRAHLSTKRREVGRRMKLVRRERERRRRAFYRRQTQS